MAQPQRQRGNHDLRTARGEQEVAGSRRCLISGAASASKRQTMRSQVDEMYNGRIARFDAPNQPFTVQRVRPDEVRRGEILIKVKRANICGSDLHAWHGDFSTRGLGGKFPTVLGHEMVGTIEELGDGVTTDASGKPLAKGTRVVFPYFTSCGSCRPPGGPPRRLPEDDDGDARQRRPAPVLCGRVRRLLPATGGLRCLHSVGFRVG